MVKRKFIALLIFAICFGVACKANLKETMVGKWKATESPETWEFRSDNGFTLTKTEGEDTLTVSGTYAIEDEQTISLTAIHNVTNQPLQPIRAKVSINDDEMTFEDPEKVHTLRRVSGDSQEKSEPLDATAPVLNSTSSPEDVFKANYDALRRKDVEAFKKTFSSGWIKDMEEMAKSFGKSLNDFLLSEMMREPEPPLIPGSARANLKGDKGEVTVQDQNGERPHTFSVVKEDGIWKLDSY